MRLEALGLSLVSHPDSNPPDTGAEVLVCWYTGPIVPYGIYFELVRTNPSESQQTWQLLKPASAKVNSGLRYLPQLSCLGG